MSYNETKLVIRLEIKQLKDKLDHEAYLYFREIFKREPDDIDYINFLDNCDENNIVNYFYYDSSEFEIVQDHDNNRWGIDYNLHCGEEYETAIINMELIDKLVDNICNLFGVKRYECKLVSYTWYNGADEPILFSDDSEDEEDKFEDDEELDSFCRYDGDVSELDCSDRKCEKCEWYKGSEGELNDC